MQIDNSTLREYCDCNVKGMIRYVLHRAPLRDSEAMWFGSQFHKFVEMYWQPGDAWATVLLNYENKFMQFTLDQLNKGSTADPEAINYELFLNVAKQFTQQLPRIVTDQGEVILLDQYSKQPLFKVRHRPEIGFKFPIGNGDEYVGRLDTLLEDFTGSPTEPTLWICDIKTTGQYTRDKQSGEARVQSTWKRQFELGTQLTGYIRGVQHNTNLPIAGALVLAVPRVRDKLRVEPIKVRRTEPQLEQWENETRVLIKHFKRDSALISQYGTEGLFDVIPTGRYNGCCTRFGVCPYHECCKWTYNRNVIEQTTTHFIWDPLANGEET